jgi:hypothetical protein
MGVIISLHYIRQVWHMDQFSKFTPIPIFGEKYNIDHYPKPAVNHVTHEQNPRRDFVAGDDVLSLTLQCEWWLYILICLLFFSFWVNWLHGILKSFTLAKMSDSIVSSCKLCLWDLHRVLPQYREDDIILESEY